MYICVELCSKLLPHFSEWQKYIISKRCWRNINVQIKWNEPLERVFRAKFPQSMTSNLKMHLGIQLGMCVCASDPAWQHRYSSQPCQSKVSNFAFSIVDCTPFFHSTSQWYYEEKNRVSLFKLNAQIQFYIVHSSDQLPVRVFYSATHSLMYVWEAAISDA